MSGVWRSQDVPRTSILNICTKRISVVVVSVLVHQVSVLDTKRLVIVYSFSFGETSYERPKIVQSHTCSVTSLGRRQDVSLNNFYKIGF